MSASTWAEELTDTRAPEREAGRQDLRRHRLVRTLQRDDNAVGGDLGNAGVSYIERFSTHRAFVWTVISERANFFSAYSEIFSEYVFRMWSRDWIREIVTSLRRSLGYCCQFRSRATGNSRREEPLRRACRQPRQRTRLRSGHRHRQQRRGACGAPQGSWLGGTPPRGCLMSATTTQRVSLPRILRRMACASLMRFSWKAFSRPLTPCVFDLEPTATTSLS